MAIATSAASRVLDHPVGGERIGDPDPPWPALRSGRAGHGFAKLHEHAGEAGRAQQLGHAIGDVSLSNPVQRHGHARAQEADPGPVHRHRPVIDAPSHSLDPVHRRTSDIVRIGCEMRGVQLPERLHGDVESPAAQRAKALRLGEHDTEVMGCRVQPARPIEGGDLGIRHMQAEDPLEARDLVEAAGDHATHRSFVGMGEQQPRLGAERAAAPLEHRRPLRRAARGQEWHAGRGGDHGERPASAAAPCLHGSAPPSDAPDLPARISARFSRRLRRSIIGGHTQAS